MTKLIKTLLILTSIIAFSYANGQVNDQVFRQSVLQKAIIDSTFISGKWTEKGNTETHLKYLGKVTTKHGQIFKIINSILFWGLSHRATSRILVFNEKNQYVGNYCVSVPTDLPTTMVAGKLIFKNIDGDCERKIITVLDLKNGLPKRFFRKCKGDSGDIYNFETE